jgi:hypothetical protein
MIVAISVDFGSRPSWWPATQVVTFVPLLLASAAAKRNVAAVATYST